MGGISSRDLEDTLAKDSKDLPPLLLSYLPILLPVVLISFISLLKVLGQQGMELGVLTPSIENANFRILSFLGEPNIAMALAALSSIVLLLRQQNLLAEGNKSSVSKILEAPLITAGSIILITGAGGAYGGMIRLSGVGEVISQYATQMNISHVLLAWGITAFVRIAQGSATVAMITGAGLMASIIGDGDALVYHPVYIFLAIGFGSITLSWMNDSGFWVVQKLSGFTEKEMLKTWSVLLTVISVAGLLLSLVGSNLIPLR